MRHDARLISLSSEGTGPVASAPGFLGAAIALCVCLAAQPLHADTIVTFTTNLGAFSVRLFEAQAPTTVANFLSYVNAGSYTNTFFHRSTTYNPADIQIVQGGGFGYSSPNFFVVDTSAPINLEAALPNTRGTIAMARTSDPNSATSPWFFNVQDNPGLNPSLGNDGYAVFGEVIGSGMDVIDAIAGLSVYNGNPPIIGQQTGPLGELPLINGNTLVMVESVVAVPEPGTLALALTCVLLYTFRKVRNRSLAIGQGDDSSIPKRTQIRLVGGTA